ncbi:rho GTPase-activating protein 12-like isoform X2 [Portunus trituberculatus]|uniref:rho GTPase-activating protein 12-like isoform X2 n=1 Tax=Portunus trituberculatus TaxID=210409 RepID=UPI001E1CD664|nr:rho GTPase-activating protein 12-like isoform X2 [Portunus trituberculatus]
MSEGNPKGEKLEEYVEALQDYQYEHHGQTFIISKGEIFLVLKSTNNIWWQVIRAGSKRAFYAPAQHLQRKSLSEEEMKRIISGHNSSSENVSFQRRSQEFDGGGPCLAQELSPNSTHATSQGLRSYPGHFQTSPLHISKSSLNEGSAESLRHQPIKPFIKSRSIDELRSGGRSHSTLDITKMREASSEELDRRASGGIQLSPRLRSSSFDLRMPPKDTEMKQGSLDKPRNSRISKDQGDRRRSWALENFRPSLKRGETVDAAIVLDVPPELPPKTRPKRGLSTFSSNPENVGHLEGPIDLKVEQARMAKSGQLSLGKEQHAGREAERRHSRHSSDPLLLLEENTSYPLYQESQNGKGPPIALPRKLLPPQTSLMESRPEVQPHIGDYSHRDANGNKVKEISSQSSIASISYATHEGSVKTREFLGSFRQKSKASEPPLGKSSGTPEMIIKNDTNLAPPQKCRPESPKTQTVKNKFSQGFGSFRNKSKRETKKEEREEPPTRETPTPDSSRGGKIVQSPPSPRCPPQRTLNGDWGEYIEEVSKRPYYYNSVTREKRWKPPRWSKGNTSNSISEVPSTGTDDRNFKGNAPQCPPKCPTPDYPTSPRLSHKPFSYTCNPDTTPIHSTHPRVAAHNSSSTSTPHSNTSQTLTNTTSATRSMSPPQISGKKLLPLSFATPPAVPPSSAKPTFPTTPTTPEFADFTAATTTDDQNYALLDILYKMKLPRGWEKKYDAFNQRIYFLNVVTRERVDEAELPDQEGCPSQPLASPSENYRLSNITENLSELSDRTLREGFLHRTFLMRDSKKVRKNWTHSYTRYIVHSFNNGCSGILYFTKNKDDEKRSEIFEFFSPCYLEHASDKKTSRQLVFGLRNGHDTEVLLHFEDKDIAQLWLKDLKTHEGIEYCANTEKEDKKGKKGSEKIKRETSVEQLSPDSKGIKDKLRNFIRRRPMKETLENKGIYKESVFGSTLAELKSQDKTNIPIFVLLCIQNIEKDEENLKTDGLYRISGNAAQIQKIRFEVAQRKHNVLSQEKEIHNLSGALKLFFRELKEPLIPYEIYDDFIRATGSEYRRMNQQADKLMKAVNKLPVENRDTLKLLMQHLLRVSEYESENRMSLSNLAIVFGPCLMWPKVTVSHDLMTDVMLHNRVVEGLLCDFDKIFSKR